MRNNANFFLFMVYASNLGFQFTYAKTEVRKITNGVFWAPFLQRTKEKNEMDGKLVFERAVFLSEELETFGQFLTYQC